MLRSWACSAQKLSLLSRRTFCLTSAVAAIDLAAGGVVRPVWADDQKTPQPPPPPKFVDFSKPRRRYFKKRLGVWTVMLEQQLRTAAPDLAAKSLDRLEKTLDQTMHALPEPCRARLQQITIFLMYGSKSENGGYDSGLSYFPNVKPEFFKHLDLRWADGLVIWSADNFVNISEFWALKAVTHELSHARHLENWPEQQPQILEAWKNAMRLNLYHGVKDEDGKIEDKAYAATNQLEYFAELSCMYFVGCNYHPFNRKELKAYDPMGYAMVEKMWGLSG